MSGGSFDYLCHAIDADDLLSKRWSLQEMAEWLERRPDMRDAAVETRTLLADISAFETRVEAHLKRLSPVWKAIEWKVSGDWSR